MAAIHEVGKNARDLAEFFDIIPVNFNSKLRDNRRRKVRSTGYDSSENKHLISRRQVETDELFSYGFDYMIPNSKKIVNLLL
jgi:hypothetical protein